MQQRIIMISLSMMMIVRFSRYLFICGISRLTDKKNQVTKVYHDSRSDCNSLNLSITLEIGISDAESISIITLFYI